MTPTGMILFPKLIPKECHAKQTMEEKYHRGLDTAEELRHEIATFVDTGCPNGDTIDEVEWDPGVTTAELALTPPEMPEQLLEVGLGGTGVVSGRRAFVAYQATLTF